MAYYLTNRCKKKTHLIKLRLFSALEISNALASLNSKLKIQSIFFLKVKKISAIARYRYRYRF